MQEIEEKKKQLIDVRQQLEGIYEALFESDAPSGNTLKYVDALEQRASDLEGYVFRVEKGRTTPTGGEKMNPEYV